ncbi:MAG TPA: ABC transporter permease [Acidiferrobacter sp.]|nr:ABC transporter permease [Acidiferrobacter sp.]
MGIRRQQIWAAIVKEFLALVRDKEAIAMLVVMPAVFVLIMSLALQDVFHTTSVKHLRLAILDQGHSHLAVQIRDSLARAHLFKVVVLTTSAGKAAGAVARLGHRVAAGHYALGLVLPAGLTTRIRHHLTGVGDHQPIAALNLFVDPALPAQVRGAALASLTQTLQSLQTAMLLQSLVRADPKLDGARVMRALQPVLRLKTDTRLARNAPVPTSVQQNAPAWALLAMFFLVVPLSVTLIKERQQGCLLRLRSMPVPAWVLLVGKAIPYFVLNSVQLAVVFWEGVYVLPLLGGTALQLGHSPGAIVLVAVAANCAAIGYGLLIATIVRTQEQATSFGAISVLIMAAIGGVMVPKLVMPQAMQHFTHVSPMAWGLEGFQAIFVRGAAVADILPETAHLLLFGGVCALLAGIRFRRELRPQDLRRMGKLG